MMHNIEKENLMRAIQVYSFAVDEATLYLNAYPDSQIALDYYNKYKALEEQAIAEYEAKYGPISFPGEAGSWQWSDGPWPWQNEEER